MGASAGVVAKIVPPVRWAISTLTTKVFEFQFSRLNSTAGSFLIHGGVTGYQMIRIEPNKLRNVLNLLFSNKAFRIFERQEPILRKTIDELGKAEQQSASFSCAMHVLPHALPDSLSLHKAYDRSSDNDHGRVT